MNISCLVKKHIRKTLLLNFVLLPVGMLFSIFSNVVVTADYSIGSWVFNLYAIFFIFGLVVLYFFVMLNKGPIQPISNDLKNGMFIIMVLGYGFLLAFVIFGGLPKIIHSFSSNEGSIELTIASKTDTRTRGRCVPSIEVEEVTFIFDNHICVSNSVFDKLKVGSKITAYGKISTVGIEINHVR